MPAPLRICSRFVALLCAALPSTAQDCEPLPMGRDPQYLMGKGIDWEDGDQMGRSVDIRGDALIAGAPRANRYGREDSGMGIVVWYSDNWAAWILEWFPVLEGPAGDEIGFSVALGDATWRPAAVHPWIVLGAPGTDAGAGTVYVSEGFAPERLDASDGAALDRFGHAVALDGDVVVVGAPGDDDLGPSSGSVYVFRHDGASWSQEAKLRASDGSSFDGFGSAVAISGNVILVGAPGTTTGTAYHFLHQGSQWIQRNVVVAPDAATGDGFGTSLAVRDGIAVIGAPYDDDQGFSSGSAHAFALGKVATHLIKLLPARGTAGAAFGIAVDFDGARAVVGAPFARNGNGESAGNAWVWQYDADHGAWAQRYELPGFAADAGYASAVAIDGERVVVGAPLHDSPAPDERTDFGFVAIYDLDWAPEVLGQPFDQTVGAGQTATFSITAAGHDSAYVLYYGGSWDAHLAFQWRKDGVDLVDDGRIDGSTTATLTVQNASAADEGRYDVVVRDLSPPSCTPSSVSHAGVLTVAEAPPVEAAQLVAPDGAAYDRFGWSVAVSAGTAVVGAPFDDDQGSSSGAVRIYTNESGGWSFAAKLLASDGAAGDRFGHAVAIDGDTAVVGAFLHDAGVADAGAAYVFQRVGGSWVQEAKLVAPDALTSDRFASAVAIHGDRIVVGAYLSGAGNEGAAYVFEREGTAWDLVRKLAGYWPNGRFGTCVAVWEDQVVVGEPYYLYGSTSGTRGRAHVYRSTRSESAETVRAPWWSWEATLESTNPQSGDSFGSALAMHGDLILVGASGDSSVGTRSGAVYVFRRTDAGDPGNYRWGDLTGDPDEDPLPEAVLVAPSPDPYDRFGAAVAFDGGLAVVGAPYADVLEVNTGAAYAFLVDGASWSLQGVLAHWDPQPADALGRAVAVDGGAILVGVDLDDDDGSGSGSSFVFEF